MSRIGEPAFDLSVRMLPEVDEELDRFVAAALRPQRDAGAGAGALQPSTPVSADDLRDRLDPPGITQFLLSQMVPLERPAQWWQPGAQLQGLMRALDELEQQVHSGSLSPVAEQAMHTLARMLQDYRWVKVERAALLQL